MATVYKYLAGGREVEFVDEQDAYKPEDIKAHWTQTFPELSNASWEEKKDEQGRKIITFAKKVGTKGSGQLSPAEALYGFAGWLTTREQRVVASARDDAAIWAELVSEFCKVNGLVEPRPHWEDDLIHPSAGRPGSPVDTPAWISTAERLPEADELVLVISPEFDQVTVGNWLEPSEGDDRGGWMVLDSDLDWVDWSVTRWMPLPPAPAEAQ